MTIVATAVSDLSAPIYYFWYLDGAYQLRTSNGQTSFNLGYGTQRRLGVLDSNDPDYDAVANAPAEYPPYRTIEWIRSLSSVRVYRVYRSVDGGAYALITVMPAKGGRWLYSYTDGPLEDGVRYSYKIIPQDKKGREGAAVTLSDVEAENTLVIRCRPNAPNFAVTVDEDSPPHLVFEVA